MSDADDWLDLPPPLPQDEKKELIAASPELKQLDSAVKRLRNPLMQTYLACYLQCHFDTRRASKLYRKVIGKPPPLGNWKTKPAFVAAFDSCSASVYDALGISVASVLGRTIELLDRAEAKGDLTAAKAFLDILARHTKVIGNDEQKTVVREGPALVINIQSPQEPFIEAPDQKTVNIKLPRPDRGN